MEDKKMEQIRKQIQKLKIMLVFAEEQSEKIAIKLTIKELESKL